MSINIFSLWSFPAKEDLILRCLEGAYLLEHNLNQAIQKFRFKKSNERMNNTPPDSKKKKKRKNMLLNTCWQAVCHITHNCNSSSCICWLIAFCQVLILKKIKHHDKFQHKFYPVLCILSSTSSYGVLDSVQTERGTILTQEASHAKNRVPGRNMRNKLLATRIMNIWHI